MAFLGETFDATSVEPAQPRDNLPPGNYTAQVIESVMKETAKGGTMLQLTLEIIDGPSKGRRVWDNLNIKNPNPTAQEIALRTLSAICLAIGKQHISDSEEIHFLPMTITVAVEVDNRDKELPPDEQRRRNVVKGYAAARGDAPVAKAPSSFTSRQAPPPSTPRPAAPAAGGVPPWRK
jgi:ribosomal protein S28E/S33